MWLGLATAAATPPHRVRDGVVVSSRLEAEGCPLTIWWWAARSRGIPTRSRRPYGVPALLRPQAHHVLDDGANSPRRVPAFDVETAPPTVLAACAELHRLVSERFMDSGDELGSCSGGASRHAPVIGKRLMRRENPCG